MWCVSITHIAEAVAGSVSGSYLAWVRNGCLRCEFVAAFCPELLAKPLMSITHTN